MSEQMTGTAGTQAQIAGLLDQGAAAVRAGNLPAGEAFFRQVLVLAPDHPLAAHNLALVLLNTSRQAEAEGVLLRAAQRGAALASIVLLGDIFAGSGRDAEALAAYDIVLKKTPQDFDLLMKLAGVKDRLGDKPGAR